MSSIKGVPIVVSGPSGVGKNTVVSQVMKVCPELIHSTSMTTRSPRPGEKEGQNYFFVSEKHFQKAIQNQELAEWATVYENYYGTLRSFLDEQFNKGLDVILDVDIQGAASIKTLYQDAILIHLIPPSLEALRERLFSRKKGKGDDLNHRIDRVEQEMRYLDIFNYFVINNILEDASNDVHSIIRADRLRRDRISPMLISKGIIPGHTKTQGNK